MRAPAPRGASSPAQCRTAPPRRAHPPGRSDPHHRGVRAEGRSPSNVRAPSGPAFRKRTGAGSAPPAMGCERLAHGVARHRTLSSDRGARPDHQRHDLSLCREQRRGARGHVERHDHARGPEPRWRGLCGHQHRIRLLVRGRPPDAVLGQLEWAAAGRFHAGAGGLDEQPRDQRQCPGDRELLGRPVDRHQRQGSLQGRRQHA